MAQKLKRFIGKFLVVIGISCAVGLTLILGNVFDMSNETKEVYKPSLIAGILISTLVGLILIGISYIE